MDIVTNNINSIIDMIIGFNDDPNDNPEYFRGQIELAAEMLDLPLEYDDKLHMIKEMYETKTS